MKFTAILSFFGLSLAAFAGLATSPARADSLLAVNRCHLYPSLPDQPHLTEFRMTSYLSELNDGSVLFRVDFDRSVWDATGAFPNMRSFQANSIAPALRDYAPHFTMVSFARNKGEPIYSMEVITQTKRQPSSPPYGRIRVAYRTHSFAKTTYRFTCTSQLPLSLAL